MKALIWCEESFLLIAWIVFVKKRRKNCPRWKSENCTWLSSQISLTLDYFYNSTSWNTTSHQVRNWKEFCAHTSLNYVVRPRTATCESDMRHLFQVSGSESIKINTAAGTKPNKEFDVISTFHWNLKYFQNVQSDEAE